MDDHQIKRRIPIRSSAEQQKMLTKMSCPQEQQLQPPQVEKFSPQVEKFSDYNDELVYTSDHDEPLQAHCFWFYHESFFRGWQEPMCERRKCLNRTFGMIKLIFYKDIGGLIFYAFQLEQRPVSHLIDLDENLYCCGFEQLLY